jgi:hypothetical protein
MVMPSRASSASIHSAAQASSTYSSIRARGCRATGSSTSSESAPPPLRAKRSDLQRGFSNKYIRFDCARTVEGVESNRCRNRRLKCEMSENPAVSAISSSQAEKGKGNECPTSCISSISTQRPHGSTKRLQRMKVFATGGHATQTSIQGSVERESFGSMKVRPSPKSELMNSTRQFAWAGQQSRQPLRGDGKHNYHVRSARGGEPHDTLLCTSGLRERRRRLRACDYGLGVLSRQLATISGDGNGWTGTV